MTTITTTKPRAYYTQAAPKIPHEYFMTTKDLTEEGKKDNNICVQYKILPEEILNMEISQEPCHLDFRWFYELHTEENVRRLIGKIPSMGELSDWLPLLIMSLDKGKADGDEEGEKIILKGAFFNQNTRVVAFQTSYSPGCDCESKVYPIKCHEEGWTSQTRRMCAPITFWRELQAQVYLMMG